ncbi:MAG: ribosomal protein S18-alanine N-acetyltransferase [Wenzhouxiangella sp.]
MARRAASFGVSSHPPWPTDMAAVLEPTLFIRQMQKADLATVVSIEQQSYPFPWSRGIFSDCLQVGYRCHVLTDNETIIGYAVVSMAVDEAHLLNLCIRPDQRRRGLACVMLDHVVREVRIAGMDRLFLEVRPSNRAAVKLYRQYGFKVIGRRPDYYPGVDGREDARVMVLHLEPE